MDEEKEKKPEPQAEPPRAQAPVFPAIRDVIENGLNDGINKKGTPLKD